MTTHEHAPVGGKLFTVPVIILMMLLVPAAIVLVQRFVFGLGSMTHLSDGYPWGIWIAIDLIIGTALGCGGLVVALLVYILNRGQYHPIVRAALMTSLFGYVLGAIAVMIDLGRWWQGYNILLPWLWTVNSVLLETALCIFVYILVLLVEFAPTVFERFGIDFCCGGRRSLADACVQAGVNAADVVLDLVKLNASQSRPEDDVTHWSPTRLVTHIVGRHHGYIRSATPMIGAYLSRLVEAHGARHPELSEVRTEFDRLTVELRQHMMKEEQVLFPYILELAEFDETGAALPPSPFGTVANPIRMMEREHQEVGDELRAIRDLTHGFTAPPDGCTTYRVAMAELERFERDLHEHVHLENNVLFPAAVAIEARLAGAASTT